ncbi:ammonium transporter [Leptospira ryugenii]|uniref:Ammonium transporter n=1 Tax=Leptospira ryugenii TaxID=1917863 RepID=A0A2P2E0H1_9LEPT|nr:ammonium transporter [Leptospira ryugenii]GBF50373.1 ammonium transporter [Leptospira ryugenii]
MLEKDFDILWIIICSGLVFFMQAGFLCLESGLTRTKNSINVAIKNITDFGIATILFYTVGYGLMYGNSIEGWYGADHFLPEFSLSNPKLPVFFLFQLMFCGTAATIVSGAVAERMKFGAYILITAMISSIIYPFFGHWVWGRSLADLSIKTGWLAKLGFVDFAGSTVVHSVGGWVGLSAMMIIGNRMGKFDTDGKVNQITGNNLPIAMLGTLILWFGWIGFNGGSTLAFSKSIPGILANTMLAASGGMAAALIYGWLRLSYAEATLPLNGALAGLVSITASCHAVRSEEALFIGFVSGILMFETRKLLERFQLDDAVGAIPVHLTGGIWGTLAVGLFANLETLHSNLTRWGQIQVQALGIIACGLIAFSLSYLLLSLINRFYPLRVSESAEKQGLNFTEHRATTELYDLFSEMEYQKQTGDLSKNVSIEPFTEVGQIAERYNLVLEKIRTNIKEKEQLTHELELNLGVIQNDLNTAKKIQASILNQEDRLIGDLEITIRYLPLSEVGGDFFDIAELKPGLQRIFIADATGHGVQAALITMAIKTIYESLKRGHYSVHELLKYLNSEYYHSFKNLNQFFTCTIIDIDSNRNLIRYASAGHPPQFLIRDQVITRLEKTGRIIGVKPSTEYTSHEFEFLPGNAICLFTDGLTEQWNADQLEFGEMKLEEYFQQKEVISFREDIDKILELQKNFLEGMPLQDDITVIGVSRKRLGA